MVRLLIALELSIGLFYLFGIHLKKTNRIALIIIIGLSVWLLFQWISGNTENCHCFGDTFQMSPAESLIKNGIILLFIFLLFIFNSRQGITLPQRFTLWGAAFIVTLSLAVPCIVSPPDFLVANRYNLNGVASEINFEKLDSVPWKNTNTPILVTEGKKIVLFMSMKCNMCRKAARKISIINARYSNMLPVSYIFLVTQLT